ncbi:MAG: pyridoxal 5'-phosphate synthase glutaminase subunit PdxT [Actinomycetota bacterium]|nr:pyridoxal 5'-phosphate synthase glutaminase subunit PdxT [Actinomycetota bacterium]
MGVVAVQGAATPHLAMLRSVGATAWAVRVPADVDGVDGLVLPGGESTTISMMLERNDLWGPLGEAIADGVPTLATCAGMILLANEVVDGRPDQRSFGALDVTVRRNGYGRQVDSFEADLDVTGLGEPLRAVFIRAPVVERVGPDVEVLAEVDGGPVLCRQGPIVASAFHPELSDDTRVHELLSW